VNTGLLDGSGNYIFKQTLAANLSFGALTINGGSGDYVVFT